MNEKQKNKLPVFCSRLFEAKVERGITFAQLGEKIGRDEVWVAAVFYGQAKPNHEEITKLADALGTNLSNLSDFNDKSFFPDKGGLVEVPPTDPLIYRFYEIIQVYGYPLKAVIHEKFGDGIMSAIDFTARVDKVVKDGGERVKVTFEGKFLPYKKW
ncbi:14014_t:CDS:2 [Ambispora leptoticha]|uniref:Cyanate hydratase n=1 Tax=Ambispora leptoticha TaxID=144679 RepID=A0A9N8YM49_9GLOM|nr:14014_t:CDS:2 [Ambispora leptoticha]